MIECTFGLGARRQVNNTGMTLFYDEVEHLVTQPLEPIPFRETKHNKYLSLMVGCYDIDNAVLTCELKQCICFLGRYNCST